MADMVEPKAPVFRIQSTDSKAARVGDRFAVRTTVRDVFFGEVLPNPVPLAISRMKHDWD